MAESDVTTDHGLIRQWVEERGGFPATVEATTQGDEPGILRIDFPGYSGEDTLTRIDWDDFFAKFEESKLAFLFQERTNEGELSRFCKFIAR